MRKLLIAAVAVLTACIAPMVLLSGLGPSLNWPDRRPVGALFLASHAHASRSNPRGWFNDPALDIAGPGGAERFRRALFDYADRSIAILRATNSQGMIVWDLEGEEFPHKTTYIGDPRLLGLLDPEMDAAADEFFARFRNAGFRVGLTIRPQQFVATPEPKQQDTGDVNRLLLEKLDYARRRWGASLFYIDSNAGIRRPTEALHLKLLARSRPGILLIPEHTDALYYGFSAPYGSVERGNGVTSGLLRTLFPEAFQVLDVSDVARPDAVVREVVRNRDIVLFRAWFCGIECKTVQNVRTVN